MAGKSSVVRAVITGGAARRDALEAYEPEAEELADVEGKGEQTGEDEAFADELKPGTTLFHGQYTIIDFLNSGGFGITYLAKDSLDRTVVIKECFPGTLCRRSNSIVRARSRAHQSDFRSVVRLFVQEARNLSKLVHPNIVGVHQVFEDNDTAYMAIDYVRGRDLLDLIEDKGVTFAPARIVNYVHKMLEAVRFVHDSGVLHRDISPDNILIDDNDEPVLIDFGAAREQASKQTRALSTLRIVKDGYSPQEFYIAGSLQNESSDLYALAATFYHVISGSPPPDSQRRLSGIAEGGEDPYVPLAGRFPGYPPGFLEALDKAASVLPKDRLRSAEDWMRMVEEAGRAASAREDSARAAEIESAVAQLVAMPAEAPGTRPPAFVSTRPPEALPQAANAAAILPEPTPRRRPGLLIVLIGLVAAAAAVAGYLALSGGSEVAEAPPRPAPAVAVVEAPPPPAAVPVPPAASGAAAEAPEAVPLPVAEPAPPPVLTDRPEAEAQAAVAAAASAVGTAAARRLALAATGLTYDPPPAAPARDPAVLADQVAAGEWRDLVLPFETRTVRIGGDDFPEVTAVQPQAALLPQNGWLRPGVTIYSVDNVWVTDQASIEDRLAAAVSAAEGGPVVLQLRIRETLDEPFQLVPLAVPGTREVTFASGLTVRTEPADGGWRAVVVTPGGRDPEEGGLQAGDVILAERTTGRAVDAPTAVEEIMAALAAESRTEAWLTVLRDGAETRAVTGLARAD